jgi:photosystem II stability/assembly factor-like uncharacterized protein
MRYLLILSLLLPAPTTKGQWTILNVPVADRYDDIFFLNDTLGWACSTTNIYKTTDAGVTWTTSFSSDKYLRCIEFATPMLGFCGSFESAFYKSTDGGMTWYDIASTISPQPPGICGLSIPDSNTIYGCGIFTFPGYVVKSIDGGNTWTNISLNAYAKALVDIYFINADTGFVSGMSNPTADGGIILYTTDGGVSWEVKHRTFFSHDYVWKMQTPDGKHIFGSVESTVASGMVRMLSSPDSGMTWNTVVVSNIYDNIQVVGFLDSLHGWTGGGEKLFETTDGGLSWSLDSVGEHYNRFFRMNDTTGYLTGAMIYKYDGGLVTAVSPKPMPNNIHALTVTHNPKEGQMTVTVEIARHTNCHLNLFSETGALIHTFFEGELEKGKYEYSFNAGEVPGQVLFVVMHTNEGQQYKKLVKTDVR